MKIYTAKDIVLMGDPDPTYGQTYFGSVHEQAHPVRFNLKAQVDFMDGRKFTAEEYEERKGKKAPFNPYTQLKKVSTEQPTAEPEQASWMPEEEEIQPLPSSGEEPSEEPSYEAGTNARWALKEASQTYRTVMGRVPENESDWTMIEDYAKFLIEAFGRLKVYKGKGE